MEIKKGKTIYKNISVSPNNWKILGYNELIEELRTRKLTSNGENTEQTKAELLTMDDMNDNYADYWLVEYINGNPNKLVEISRIICK